MHERAARCLANGERLNMALANGSAPTRCSPETKAYRRFICSIMHARNSTTILIFDPFGAVSITWPSYRRNSGATSAAEPVYAQRQAHSHALGDQSGPSRRAAQLLGQAGTADRLHLAFLEDCRSGRVVGPIRLLAVTARTWNDGHYPHPQHRPNMPWCG